MRLLDSGELGNFPDGRVEDFCGVAYLLAYRNRKCPWFGEVMSARGTADDIGRDVVLVDTITRVTSCRDRIAMTGASIVSNSTMGFALLEQNFA
jgi:hypothetical protein